MRIFTPSATDIFLSSVHRAEDSTGERPKNTIVSSALMTLIVAQCGLQLYPTASINGNSLFGYPIKVVKSDWLFAVSIDSQEQ